jgi:hypothetical protein
MIPRIHALCDAFAKLNGALDSTSDAYKLRNPLLLKAFSLKHDRDEKGRRRFRSFTSGYDNGIIDLQIKCSGKSFSKIGPESTLVDLVCLYGNPRSAGRYITNFLRHALEDDTITENVPLAWFLEAPQAIEILEVTNDTN